MLSQDKIDGVPHLLEPWFIFSLIWSVGATCDGDGRKAFSNFLRKKIEKEEVRRSQLVTAKFASDVTDLLGYPERVLNH